MRYAANRAAGEARSIASPRSVASPAASYGSGPLKADGTPDMRYAANRRR